MTEAGDDLKTTSESIVDDAERLRDIEERKQELDEDDPELLALAEEAERIARRLVPKTVAEREIATQSADDDG